MKMNFDEFKEESMERDKKKTMYGTMFKTEICHLSKTWWNLILKIFECK